MTTFGILDMSTGKLTQLRYDGDNHDRKVASYLLRKELEGDDKPYTVQAIKQYMTEWAEVQNEIDEDGDYTAEGLVDFVADTIVYGRSYHIIDMATRSEVDHAFKKSVMTNIERIIDASLSK